MFAPLQALGVKVDLGPEGIAQCIEQAGIAFMFSPRYHPAMKAVAPVRRSLKVRPCWRIIAEGVATQPPSVSHAVDRSAQLSTFSGPC